MGNLEEFKREDIRDLLAVLIELYYIILSLNPIIYEHTRINLKGYEVALPTELIRVALLLKRVMSALKEVWKAVYSPARMLVEELKISNIVEGRVDIPLTSRLLGQGLLLVASRKTKLALESIENIFLKAFLKRVEKDVEKFLESIENFSCKDAIYEEVFKAYTENVRNSLRTIQKNVKEMCEKTFLKYIKIKPNIMEDRGLKRLSLEVFERKMYPYSSIALLALEYIKTNMLTLLTKYVKEAEEVSNLKLRLWDYKLYEVYTYYVITYATAKILNAHQILMLKDEVFLLSRDYEVKITYDKVPECRSWVAHGESVVYNGNVVIPAGRPDITIQLGNNVVSVCDAKYRVSMKELSESRFKVLGYMHEYGSTAGALIFDPLHTIQSYTIGIEVKENVEFLKEIMRHKGVIINDKDKTLYIIPLKPKPPAELTESREYKIIEDMVKKSIKGNLT